jgi:hypothetical protein
MEVFRVVQRDQPACLLAMTAFATAARLRSRVHSIAALGAAIALRTEPRRVTMGTSWPRMAAARLVQSSQALRAPARSLACAKTSTRV